VRLAPLLVLATAAAAVLADCASAAVVERRCDPLVDPIDCPVAPLVVTAAPGEANRLTFSHDGRAVTVRDAGGAALTAGPGCARSDPDAVRCEAPLVSSGDPLPVTVDAGDGDDVVDAAGLGTGGVLVAVSIEGGAGDDALALGDLRVVSAEATPSADGGPGRDWVAGGAQRDLVEGGTGEDVLLGGAGDDSLNGDPGAARAADVMAGGDGTDTAGYEDRTAPVTVDLADEGPDGSPGEGDRLSDVESVVGGSGDTVLRGDDEANELVAPYGNSGVVSRVIGRGGDDRLTGRSVDGGAGDDVLSARVRIRCGPGRDVVFDPRLLAPRPRRECERMDLDGLIVDAWTARRRAGGVLVDVERTERGRGFVLLRVAGRTVARRRVPRSAAARVLRLPLAAAAARALRRERGRAAVVYDPAAPGVPTRGFRIAIRRQSSRSTRAGLPATTVRGATSRVTTAPAPTTASSPTSSGSEARYGSPRSIRSLWDGLTRRGAGRRRSGPACPG
jgi:hemolysin type calcium-binding protein